jgi:hypothetical protein
VKRWADVGLNATETPVPEQFGNEFVKPLSSLLWRHPFQAAHAYLPHLAP